MINHTLHTIHFKMEDVTFTPNNINDDLIETLLFEDRRDYCPNSLDKYKNCLNNPENENNNDNDNENSNDNLNKSIYRFKFTQAFMDELYKFSKIHQYDDRKLFKESWTNWLEEERELVNTEMNRMNNLGYNGNILDKMFKSARYYFRKKSISKHEPKERRKYVSVHKDLLDLMDSHIIEGRTQPDYKPSDGFEHFCKNNIEHLKEEILRLLENNMDSHEIMKKIKKTYKNRYFISITK